MSEIGVILAPLGPRAQFSLYSILAGITALMWDTLLTFNEERELVWRSKWTPIKCVFIIVRYLSLSLHWTSAIILYTNSTFSDKFCRSYIFFEAIAGVVLVSATDILLIYRAYAFYGRNRTVLLALILLGGLGQIANYSILFIELPSIQEIGTPIPEFRPVFGSCLAIHFSPNFRLIWVPKLIFQTILFGFVFGRILYTRLSAETALQSPVYNIFVRDGIWAYIIICVVLSLCVAYNANAALGGISFVVWEYTIISVCCCRLILNLRSLNQHQQDKAGIGSTIPSDDSQVRFRSLEASLYTTQFTQSH